jgi:hypothetical protein
MGCCGQGRAALARSAAGPTASHGGRLPGVKLRYFGGRQVRVRGAATGTVYSFARSGIAQPVHAADVPALLRTGLFAK